MDKEHNCGCGCNENEKQEECTCDCHENENHEGCDCGSHDHDHDHELTDMATMTLTLDDNSELECYVLGIFDCGDSEYIALLPVGEEDVFLYKYQEKEEQVILDTIEDDDEYDKVSEVFMELFNSDEEDFEDEE